MIWVNCTFKSKVSHLSKFSLSHCRQPLVAGVLNSRVYQVVIEGKATGNHFPRVCVSKQLNN